MWSALADTRELRHTKVRLLTPWYDGRAEIIPFRYLPVLLGGKGTSHVERERKRKSE
jgi:hypothetical protein